MGGCVSRKSIVNKNDNGIINYNVINQSYLENRKRFLIIQNNMNKCFKENSKFHDKIKAIYSCQLYTNLNSKTNMLRPGSAIKRKQKPLPSQIAQKQVI